MCTPWQREVSRVHVASSLAQIEPGSFTPILNVFQFVMHSDLGQIIRQIVDEFQRSPPKFISL
jgi:hypothetical protein